jgi:CHAT domain-containing protein
LIEKADRLAWLYNWYLAGPLYAEAEKLFKQTGDSRNALYAKIGRLRSEWETMSFPEVSEYLATELDSPLVENDPQLRLWILDAKGAADLEVNVASARRVYEEARDLARKLGDKAREARAAGELGIIAFLTGEAGNSADLLGQALRSSIEFKDIGAHIRYLNLLGNGLTLFGRPEDAIRYFDRALQTVKSTPELDTSVLAVAGKAKALIALNKHTEAEKLFQDTLERARLRERHGLAATILTEFAELKRQAGDRKQAIEYYEEAAALAEKNGLHRVVAMAMFGSAKLYRDAGDLEKAEDRAAAGVRAAEQVGETYEMPKRLALLAGLRSDRGKFDSADQLYQQAEDIIDGLLVSVPSPSARTGLISVMSQVYVDHFTLVVDQLKDSVKALDVLERARGRTAADVLSNRERTPVNRAQAQTAQERNIARLQIRLMRATTRAERVQILERLFEEEQGFSDTRPNLVPRTLGRGQPVDLSELQSSLAEDEVILEYALGSPKSHCLVISKREIRAVLLPDRDQIEGLVDVYLGQLRSRKTAKDSARRLYDMLVEPLGASISRQVIVVPDGRLHLLPFDSLVNAKGDYLLAGHVVTYAPSSTVLHLLRTQPEISGSGIPLLAIGDVPYQGSAIVVTAKSRSEGTTRGLYDAQGQKLPALPGTAEEVATIAGIVGPRSILLMGQRATEVGFRSQVLDRIKVIHIAAHGVSSNASPERAALVLARSINDENDGLLQAREISQMHLAAELVTLSACETGAGRLVGQEGIVNLVRSFLFAGARTVVASLWAADDVFTTSLMKRFYGNLAKGLDRGVALQRAKLELIEQVGDQAVPFYWAGFTLVGEGARPIKFSE